MIIIFEKSQNNQSRNDSHTLMRAILLWALVGLFKLELTIDFGPPPSIYTQTENTKQIHPMGLPGVGMAGLTGETSAENVSHFSSKHLQ